MEDGSGGGGRSLSSLLSSVPRCSLGDRKEVEARKGKEEERKGWCGGNANADAKLLVKGSVRRGRWVNGGGKGRREEIKREARVVTTLRAEKAWDFGGVPGRASELRVFQAPSFFLGLFVS